MNPHELLEMASLDALGLLDEEERAEFEAAFNAASPELQAAVRRAQLRATDIDAMLPSVEPPPGLRARVLSAVRSAIAAVTVEAAVQDHAAIAGHIGDRSLVKRLLNFAPMWRAACLAFATATIVLTVFNGLIKDELDHLRDRQTTEAIAMQFGQEFGPEFVEAMMSPRSQWLAFAPAAQDLDPQQVQRLRAKVLFDPVARTAFFRVEGLPSADAKYLLVIEDSAGNARKRLEFYGHHDAVFRRVQDVDEADVNGMAIYGPDSSGVITAPLLRAVAAL